MCICIHKTKLVGGITREIWKFEFKICYAGKNKHKNEVGLAWIYKVLKVKVIEVF